MEYYDCLKIFLNGIFYTISAVCLTKSLKFGSISKVSIINYL